MTEQCISFQRSLELLCIPECPAYGVETYDGDSCVRAWSICDRERWINALLIAQREIERDIGSPLCPQEICDEPHRPRCDIKLRFAPIAYLGKKVFYDGGVEAVAYTEDYGSVTICPVPDDVTVENIKFKYSGIVSGKQSLQKPTVTEDLDCDGLGARGITATWKKCQLASPLIEVIYSNNPDHFIENVEWCYYLIDEDLAVTTVDRCDCGCGSYNCCSRSSTSVEINDPIGGKICLTGYECFEKVYINYATAFNCNDGIDESLEYAVVLRALTLLGLNQPCGCDDFNRLREYWLETDPTASQSFAKDIVYGSSRAGMHVWRTMLQIHKRKRMTDFGSGGYFGGRPMRGIGWG